MDKSKSISPYQIFSVIFVTIVFSAMMYSNYTVNNLDLLMLAVSAIFAIVVLSVLSIPLFIFAKRSENENIIRIIQAKKPVLSSIFSLVYIVYFMYSALVSLLVFSLLLSNFINPGLPFFAFFLLTLSCCYYSAYKGIAAIGRAATIFSTLIMLSIIIICFSLVFRINLLNYSHIFIEQPSEIFDNTIYLVAYASSIPSMFFFVHKIKGKVKKTVLSSVIVSNLTISALSIISFGVLGEYIHTTPYPFYTATQLIELGAFQRLDVIFLALWTVGMFVNVSLSLCALRECVQNSIMAEKAKILNPVLVIVVGICAFISVRYEPIRYIVMNSKIMLVTFVVVTFIFPLIAVLAMGRRKISSRAARTATLTIAVLLCIPLLSGCQKTQIHDRMIIKGVGIDKYGEEYAVTVQYIDNYSDGSEQQNKCIQVKGKSIGDAMGKIKNSSGSEPFLGQNSAIIVGWETAKGDMEAILDYFIRYSDARPTVKLYVSETTAEDILTLKVSDSIIPIDHMTTISPSNSKNDNLFTILNFINQSKNSTDTPTATVIRVDQNTIKLSSVAAIGGEGEIYELDENDFITYKTLIGIDNGTVLSFDGLSGRVTKCGTNITAKDRNDTLDFDISCKLDITILENPDNLSESEIERIFSEELHNIADSSVKDMLNVKNYDVYSLGRHLKFSDSKKYNNTEFYTESLKNCNVNINIECKTVETTR